LKEGIDLAGGKVGVALGGGSARGLAHIGVLRVLERERIPIDMVAGTSMGAMIGAVYARDKDSARLEELALETGLKRFPFLADLSLSRTGLLKGRRIEKTLKTLLGDVTFSDLKIPFACVATDINTGEEVVIREGSVWEGVRASGSLPVIFAIAKMGGRHLVDGGLVNPVPVNVLKTMGADFIIAVNVMRNRNVKQSTEPNIFTIAMQTLYIASYKLTASCLREADIVIEPDMAHIGFADFHRVHESILQGELATQDAIPEIRRRYWARS
jgi:NTE family protein